jgi:hypothetical protein
MGARIECKCGIVAADCEYHRPQRDPEGMQTFRRGDAHAHISVGGCIPCAAYSSMGLHPQVSAISLDSVGPGCLRMTLHWRGPGTPPPEVIASIRTRFKEELPVGVNVVWIDRICTPT